MSNMIWVICAVLFLAGIVIIGLGIILRGIEKKMRKYQGEAPGTVVDIVEKYVTDGKGVRKEFLHPVIVFFANGHRYRELTETGYKPCPYKPQQQVDIRYDVKNPKNFVFSEEYKAKDRAKFVYGLGILLCIFSIVMYIFLVVSGLQI